MNLVGKDPFEWRRIIRRCRLGASCTLVASVLADYASRDGTDVRPGNDRLVNVTELSDKTVRNALDKLRGLGLIERIFEGSKMGRRGLADEYRLTMPDDLIERVEMLDPDEQPVDNSLNTGSHDRCSAVDNPAERSYPQPAAATVRTGTPVTEDGTPVTDAKNTGNGYRPPNQAPTSTTPTNKLHGPDDHGVEVEDSRDRSPPVDNPQDHPLSTRGPRPCRPSRPTRRLIHASPCRGSPRCPTTRRRFAVNSPSCAPSTSRPPATRRLNHRPNPRRSRDHPPRCRPPGHTGRPTATPGRSHDGEAAMSAHRTPIRAGLHPVIAALIQARRDRNLSQSALAERLGVTQVQVHRWESGRRGIAFADLVRWAAAFGLDVLVAAPEPVDGPIPELIAGGLS